MKQEFEETKDFLQYLSDILHQFSAEHFPPGLALTMQIILKILLFILVIGLADFLVKVLFRLAVSAFSSRYKERPLPKAVLDSKMLNSFANFVAISFASNFIQSIFYYHKITPQFLNRVVNILVLLALFVLFRRILVAVEKFYVYRSDNYRLTAIRAITQSLGIIGYILFGIVFLMLIFGVSKASIVGTLGAMTAVILLVFRDTILGFVTGIHVSTSRMVKIGDWIAIPKYNLEGNIIDINLLTTKVLNFDKTVSTIPTYDLLSTEVKNHQIMFEGNSRRIKKSIVFNVNSFIFLTEEHFEKLSKINLIKEYLHRKKSELAIERGKLDNADHIINGHQLTNIGVFRKYATAYLENNPKISQDELIVVRQLEVTSAGMPLEIMCFSKTSELAEFENIQADIFDHLLAAATEFELEIMQFSKSTP